MQGLAGRGGEQCLEPDLEAKPRSRSIQASTIKKSVARADSNRNLLALQGLALRDGEQCLEPDSKAKPWSRSILASTIKRRSTARADSNRYLAKGEYTHALRLTSELVDLRAGYANLYSEALPRSRSILTSTIKRRSTARADLLFMAPATGIEPVTNP